MSKEEIQALILEEIRNHTHDDINSRKLLIEDLQKLASGTISLVSGTADTTYSANEVTLINSLTTAVNSLINLIQNQ